MFWGMLYEDWVIPRCYSLGDEDYDCRGRKWEIKEK